MTQMHGGPANGQNLMLRAAPRLLRVTLATERGKPKFDALDQPEDRPQSGERLFAYELDGEATNVHVNMGRKGSGWYKLANYKFIPAQPTDAEMRTGTAWLKWCESYTTK